MKNIKIGDQVKLTNTDMLFSGCLGIVENINENKENPLTIRVDLVNGNYIHYYCRFNNIYKIS